MSNGVQCFGQVEFGGPQGRLIVGGRPVELDRPCRAILSLLIREAGQDVSKDRLLEAGWPGHTVDENSLAKAISRLRRALGEDGAALETVHRHGYRLAADVQNAVPGAAAASPLRGWAWLRPPAVVLAAAVTVSLAAAAAYYGETRADAEARVVNSEPRPMIGRVLWVDDHPENNAHEKRHFEDRKIAVYQVASTEEALALLSMYRYTAVISDMGRHGNPLAGLALLEEMRGRKDATPFVLYTVRSSPAQRRIVAEAGGQRVAQTRDELYAAVLPLAGAASRVSLAAN